MQAGHPVSWLMFGTLAVVLALLVFLILRFFRKPGRAHPMAGERERNIGEIRRDGPE